MLCLSSKLKSIGRKKINGKEKEKAKEREKGKSDKRIRTPIQTEVEAKKVKTNDQLVEDHKEHQQEKKKDV